MANDKNSGGEPQDMFKAMLGQFNMNLPGLMMPTFDASALEKKITDMKAVEGWLEMNLNMLKATIKTMEMQHSGLTAMQQMSNVMAAHTAAATAKPEAEPAEPVKGNEGEQEPPPAEKA